MTFVYGDLGRSESRSDSYIFYTTHIKRKTNVRYRGEKDESPGLGNSPTFTKILAQIGLALSFEGRADAFWEIRLVFAHPLKETFLFSAPCGLPRIGCFFFYWSLCYAVDT